MPKQVFCDNQEITNEIRTAEIDRSVSAVSAVPEVRQALVDQQRRIGSEGNYVVEGRVYTSRKKRLPLCHFQLGRQLCRHKKSSEVFPKSEESRLS